MANIFSRSLWTLGAVLLVGTLLAPSAAQANKGTIILKNESGYTQQVAYDLDGTFTDYAPLGDNKSLTAGEATNIEICIKIGGGQIGYVHFFKKKETGAYGIGTKVVWQLNIDDKNKDNFYIKKTKNNSETKKTVSIKYKNQNNLGNTSQVSCPIP